MTEKQVTIGSVTTKETFTFDGLGRMLTAQKIEGATTISDTEFAYNDMGRITDANEVYYALSKKEIDYDYDNAGNRIKTVYPLSGTVINRTNTWTGQIDTIDHNGTETLADYEYIGSRVAARDFSWSTYQTNSERSYDNMGRLTKIKTYKPGTPDTIIADFDYDYAANENNIRKKTFDHRGGTPYNEYEYDDLDRLDLATYIDDSNEVFTMDDLGNRSNVNLRDDTDQVYDVNDLTNRYVSIDSSSRTYDAAGNLTVDDNGYQYTYDYENRIIEIEDINDVTVAEFAYDALGRRIKKYDSKADSTTYYYYNDKWQVLAEADSNGDHLIHFVYGNYIDEVLAARKAGPVSMRIYVHDHLYNPVALLMRSGLVTERYEYDAYGKVKVMDASYNADADNQSDYGNPYTFTGRRLDTLDSGSLELMYYRNRYYSPETGRFLTHDPLGMAAEDAPAFFLPYWQYGDSLCAYSYVGQNPMISLDPDGLRVVYYGNWCGPGLSGGATGNACPIDSLDACCQAHDNAYGQRNDNYDGCMRIVNNGGGSRSLKRRLRRVCRRRRTRDTCRADQTLIQCTDALGPDPDAWPIPPQGIDDNGRRNIDQARLIYPRIGRYFRSNMRRNHCRNYIHVEVY